jgi:hypothetical protein
MLKRIKRITSHTGYCRFLAECEVNGFEVGVIPRQPDIPSPYAYSPEWAVYQWSGKKVVIRETAHRQYDVFEVPAEMVRPASDG